VFRYGSYAPEKTGQLRSPATQGATQLQPVQIFSGHLF